MNRLTRRELLLRAGATAATANTMGWIAAPPSDAARKPERMPSSSPFTLWYDRPATPLGDTPPTATRGNSPSWLRALPLGNGRLGGMVYGNIPTERIQLNEETFWSGAPQDADNPDALAALPETRRLLFARQYEEAQKLTYAKMVCRGKGSGSGRGTSVPYGSYQTLGDLDIAFEKHDTEPTDYRRELDLTEACARVRYQIGGTRFTREAFVSAPDNVLAIHLTAEGGDIPLSFTAKLSRIERATVAPLDSAAASPTLAMRTTLTDGSGGDGMRSVLLLRALTEGGTVSATAEGLHVTGARSATLLLTASTSYAGRDPEAAAKRTLEAAARKPFADLRRAHLAEHRKFFGRASLHVGPGRDDLPTDARLERVKAGNASDDPALAALHFQYGRYLLITSSHPHSLLPAHLQGIWAEGIDTPWSCDYHHNINDQMNYWPAEVTGLVDCHVPFLNFIQSLSKPGAKTAKVHYGVPDGWVVHTISNIWGFTSPGEGASWGQFPAAAAWLCRHLWEHYAYGGDKKYLETVYPTLAGAARFSLGFLVEDPVTKHLVTAPSNSPENSFRTPEGWRGNVCMGPTMDCQILRDFFGHVIAACGILGRDADLAAKLTGARDRLPPTRIGKHGQVMEWMEDFDEPEPGHRHVSHLFGLHPAAEITPTRTPDLAAAARTTLKRRLENGGAHTGWSRAWLINFYARLGDGDAAQEHLELLLAKSTLPNLFDNHPPFQIDGNFGATAGIAEMLVQSHTEEIALLPALPKAWSEGTVSGLRARGGITIEELTWKAGRFTQATLHADRAGTVAIRLPGDTKPRQITFRAGERKTLAG